MARFINQSLVFLFQAQADYTCWKDSSLKFWKEFYIKGTLFPSSKTFSVAVNMFYWLLAMKKKLILEFIKFLDFLQRGNIRGRYFKYLGCLSVKIHTPYVA